MVKSKDQEQHVVCNCVTYINIVAYISMSRIYFLLKQQ